MWVIIGEKGVEPMAISNQLDRLSPNPMTLSESRIGDKDLSAYCAGPKRSRQWDTLVRHE